MSVDPRRPVLVIGLGRFGTAVAEALMRMGHEVLGVDCDEKLVQSAADELTQTVQADTTDMDALKALGAGEFSVAVVAIGTDIEASVLSVLGLSDLGVPLIWAKATNENHGRILRRTGAHYVVFPEQRMCAAARLQHYPASRMGGKERQHLRPAKLLAKHRATRRIRTVRLENMLRDIQSDYANFRHGRLLKWCSTPPLWHIDAVGGRPAHHPLIGR